MDALALFVVLSAVFVGPVKGVASDCTILYKKMAICDDVCSLPDKTTVEAVHFTGKVLNLDCLNARLSIGEVWCPEKSRRVNQQGVRTPRPVLEVWFPGKSQVGYRRGSRMNGSKMSGLASL